MPDYWKSIIYYIYLTLQNAEENDVYYISTVNIKFRWYGHKAAYKDYLNNNGKNIAHIIIYLINMVLNIVHIKLQKNIMKNINKKTKKSIYNIYNYIIYNLNI